MSRLDRDPVRIFVKLVDNADDSTMVLKRYRAVRSGVKVAEGVRNSDEALCGVARLTENPTSVRSGRDLQYAASMVEHGNKILDTTYRGPHRATAILKVSRSLPKPV